VCRAASARREAVLDVLDTLCLVGVGEPVLAHVQVVAKANGAAGHEDLGNGEGRHFWWSIGVAWRFVGEAGWFAGGQMGAIALVTSRFGIVTRSTWSRHGEAQTVKLGAPFDLSQNGLDAASASLT
jgi:hypothetical protein